MKFCGQKFFAEGLQRGEKSPADISFFAQQYFNNITRSVAPSKKASFPDFFANNFNPAIEEMKAYADRLSGFDNLDAAQFFSPGLYVIGATPAAGKTTFCWQLLEQLAQRGESCIFCSYEMSQLELFSKSLARELFKRVPATDLTAADIRRGAHSIQLANIIDDFSNSKLNLSILELQDESIDELLSLLKPFCYDKAKAPVICLDYLQIVPSSKDSTKLGVDDSVRKLKKFQRDTNTTFIVINSINSFNISDARQKIDKAKKQQPRQIQLKCLKNRQGTNYDCFFNYFSAHDCFTPCDKFDDEDSDNSSSSNNRRNKM